MRDRPEGVVSIFLCGVFLILIVFTCTIIDVTRIHIASSQAERALYNASHSVLAAYDAQLQSQYGIFARDISEGENIQDTMTDYMAATLKPNSIQETFNPFISFYKPTRPSFNLYDYSIETTQISNRYPLIHAPYIKLQILEFMKFRAPLIALDPFIEKMGVISRASKTSEIIERKNDIVTEVQKLQNSFVKLEMLIDGIMVDVSNRTYILDSEGQPALSKNYVKRLATSDTQSAIYTEAEMPLESYRKLLSRNIWKVDETLERYKATLLECQEAIKTAFMEYEKLKAENLQLERLIEKRNRMDPSSESYAINVSKINIRIARTKGRIKEIKANIKAVVTDFNALDDWIYKETLPLIDALYQEQLPNGDYGYLGLQKAALFEIETIKAQTPHIVEKIEALKPELENKEGRYLQETCNSISEEVKNYEKLLGINEAQTLSVVNNLLVMEEKLKHNCEVLPTLEVEVKGLLRLRSPLYRYWWEKGRSTNTTKDLEILSQYFNPSFNTALNQSYDDFAPKKAEQHLERIETKLDGYDRGFYFDYGLVQKEGDEKFKFSDLKEMAKSVFPKVELPSILLTIQEEGLPSQNIDVTTSLPQYKTDQIEVETSNQILAILNKMGECLENGFIKLRNDLYINEYVVGMFSCATDHRNYDKEAVSEPAAKENEKVGQEVKRQAAAGLAGGREVERQKTDSKVMRQSTTQETVAQVTEGGGTKVGTEDSMTLNHYDKSMHYLNYEAEYVLFGQKNDGANLLAMIGVLFAVRIALNTISLVSDVNKMNIITNMANTIAGWWSLGIGSIVVVVVLTLIWAIVESVSDVQNLLAGERIPIIKDANTWETDIFSGASNIIKKTTNEAAQSEEISYLPSLAYVDYLRLFLLGGVVKEETKLYRILDLIQLNMSKERGETVKLIQYVTALDTQATIRVDYIFFKLPFMPSKAKDLGKAFEFVKKVTVSY